MLMFVYYIVLFWENPDTQNKASMTLDTNFIMLTRYLVDVTSLKYPSQCTNCLTSCKTLKVVAPVLDLLVVGMGTLASTCSRGHTQPQISKNYIVYV